MNTALQTKDEIIRAAIRNAQSDSRADIAMNNLEREEHYDNYMGHLTIRLSQAMDTYAQQMATGFAEWMSEGHYIPSTFFKGKWNKGMTTYTTSALYLIYKKEVEGGTR
jgi:hypothetical protein